MSFLRKLRPSNPTSAPDLAAVIARADREGVVVLPYAKLTRLEKNQIEELESPPAYQGNDFDGPFDQYLRRRLTEQHWLRDNAAKYYDRELWRQLVIWNAANQVCPDLLFLNPGGPPSG